MVFEFSHSRRNIARTHHHLLILITRCSISDVQDFILILTLSFRMSRTRNCELGLRNFGCGVFYRFSLEMDSPVVIASFCAKNPREPLTWSCWTRTMLYVGDLHPDVSEEELEETFGAVGQLVLVRLCRNKISHKSLCYAFVNFCFRIDACTALNHLNYTELRGKPMRIMWCEREPISRKTAIGNLFVKNLDPSITTARLQEIFSKNGTVISCKVAEKNGKSKGYGFVQFNSKDSAMIALDAVHGTMQDGKKL